MDEFVRVSHYLSKQTIQNAADLLKTIRLSRFVADVLSGMEDSALALKHGIAESTVGQLKNTEDMRYLVQAMTAESYRVAACMLKNAGAKAVRVVLQALDSEDERLRVNAANTLLDRIGLKAADVLDIRHEDRIGTLDTEQKIALLDEGFKEIRMIAQKKKERENAE